MSDGEGGREGAEKCEEGGKVELVRCVHMFTLATGKEAPCLHENPPTSRKFLSSSMFGIAPSSTADSRM